MAEIHCEISEVCGENIMSDDKVQKWVGAFEDGFLNVLDVERSGRSSVIIENLVQKIDKRVKDNRCFTIFAS